MSDRNQYFLNQLLPIIHSSKLLFGRDDNKGILWLYSKEWDDKLLIEVIRVFHQNRRRFKLTTWGESKLPCIMSL